ncbi:hypothetical protein GHO29_19630 [Pseudomonas helleri]|uniref:NERD domain-containing protein n=1 Tax=Pseudomonas helleri TaxID=1608996 RepID=A0A7X1Y1X1_9PSED|nr:hypothetical protein [Pseudomonas helleri]MQU28688.1 hypothetical protein [Pseudomonas helleri]
MLKINDTYVLSEKAIHNALSKLSWKLLKKEMDKSLWHKNPMGFLELVMRSDSLVNKRENEDKQNKRNLLFTELLGYATHTLKKNDLNEFEKKLGFFAIADNCFSEILKFEGQLSALKDLQPATRLWSVMNWFIRDSHYVEKKIEETFKGGKPILFGSLSITGESGVPVDPSAYHIQQVGALGSAILMESHRCNWFDGDGNVVIPDTVEVSEDDIFKSGSILYNANIWALFDDLQEQVRYLGRGFIVRDKDEHENPPKDLKFGIEFGKNAQSKILDHVAGQRNFTRETSNFFSTKKDLKLNNLLDAVAFVTGSQYLKEHHHASSSLSVLLNYGIAEDDTQYEGLTLTEWIDGFCGLRGFCTNLHSSTAKNKYLSAELITFSEKPLIQHLQSVGMEKEKSITFIKNITFHRKSRDLFDTPLIKTSSGFVIVSDILLGSVISRSIASNILSRKGEFKPKGDGLENTVKEIFNSNGIEAVSYRRKFPAPEGEYEYDTLALWEEKLFVFECKNRWLCEGRPVAIYNYSKQVQNDIKQVDRLVAGLKAHPEMVSAAFGRAVSYDEIIPCVVGGLPYAMPEKYSGIYFTDISIISRFFSERHFKVEYGDSERSDSISLYDQWESDTPSVTNFLKTLARPVQVALALSATDFRTIELAISPSIYLKSELIITKHLDLDDYKELIRSM